MTKQQDFLTALSDPVEYNLIEAIRRIEERFETVIDSRYILINTESQKHRLDDKRTWRISLYIEQGTQIPPHKVETIPHYFNQANKHFGVGSATLNRAAHAVVVFVSYTP